MNNVIRNPGPVVSAPWLADHLGQTGICLLEAQLKAVAAGEGRGGPVRIPGAQAFDLEKIRDESTDLPHMLPVPERFERNVRELGVRSDSMIVVYDPAGVYASPRVRWMFKAMGHARVAVLDGGLRAWAAAGHPVAESPVGSAAPGDFKAHPRPDLCADARQVLCTLEDEGSAVVDARSEGRFHGREPEPRAGLRPGHMPGAINIPFNAVLRDGHFRSVRELQALFASKLGVRSRLIFTCGSGVTACLPALAAELAGYREIAIYDGSWSEWGADASRPIEHDRT